MKLKKIKNYIFTFLFALFGFIIFSNSDVGAVGIVPGLTASEGQIFYANQGTSTQRMITLLAPDDYDPADSSSTMSVVYSLNVSYASYTFVWSGCKLNDYVPGEVFSRINCNGSRYEFADSSTTPTIQSITLYIQLNDDVNGNLFFDVKMSDESNFTSFYPADPSIDYENGYDNGYSFGYNNGYSLGYIDASESSNSLIGMIGAIFTGPVTMLQSIFDFEFLGINLSSLILSLTTLLVVIWLIKKFV